MTLLTCAAVRRRLNAFYDRELPVPELIAIESHLHGCPPCAAECAEIQRVGDVMRLAAGPGPADDWTGLQPGVISRMRAEAHESWTSRAARTFEDLHLVWIGAASTAATFICAVSVLGMLHFASPERSDSLAAIIAVMAEPYGSDRNPARLDWGGIMRVPSIPGDGLVSATLESSMPGQRDVMLTLSAVVSREGRVSNMELVNGQHDGVEAAEILHALSRSRLEPAQFGGSPVAVNLVWLVAHTTVKGKTSS